MKFVDSTKNEPELNLTALIDVVFLLLIFFMVSTSFDQTRLLPVTLPDADTGLASDSQVALEIVLTKRGLVEISGWQGEVQDEGFRSLIEQWRLDHPNGVVKLYADVDVPHGSVVAVMDRVSALEIKSIQLATRHNANQLR